MDFKKKEEKKKKKEKVEGFKHHVILEIGVKEGKPTLPQHFSCYQEVNCRQDFIQFSSLKSLSE